MPLPTGTVTFLFSDIEGSTRMWEHYPAEMRGALARHDALMRDAIGQNGGHVFKTIGDAFCAAFQDAPDGLNASIQAQLALAEERWPQPLSFRVRMALHTGSAEQRDGDYFGQPLNRVARLLAAANGGQILCSQATQDLVKGQCSRGIALRDLGERRLKDLVHREQIYQVLGPGLETDFPPLRTLDDCPNNLPIQLTSFVGREREIEATKERVGKSRMVTLLGPGGCGKTRLSLQAGAALVEKYSGGVWLVELASVLEPRLIPQVVAASLGVKEVRDETCTDTLRRFCEGKDLLLILDNCEHLVEGCAHLCQVLLSSCPRLRILATSREVLRVPGEITYLVPPLSKKEQTPESLAGFETVKLFVDRASAVDGSFAVTRANAFAVAAVCHRLDGIPLAIELAAARSRSMSVGEINERLDHRFRLLTAGARTALPRQQTLRSLIDWSYDLLNESERLILRRVCFFTGGWDLAAAEKVCSGPTRDSLGRDLHGVERWELLDLLSSLTDKSLVIAEPKQSGTRYRVLETVRQYGLERLAESGELESIRERHLAHFLQFAREAEGELTGPHRGAWLDRLEEEHGNLRSALDLCASSSPELMGAELEICGRLWRFWLVRGHVTEGRERLSGALGRAGPEMRNASVAKALNSVGHLAWAQGEYTKALEFHGKSLEINRELGDRAQEAINLNGMSLAARDLGNLSMARESLELALAVNQDLGNRAAEAANLNNLADVHLRLGDRELARKLFEQSLATHEELGQVAASVSSLNGLGEMALDRGDFEEASRRFTRSLTINMDVKDIRGTLDSLRWIASLGVVTGNAGRAVRLWGALERFREEFGIQATPIDQAQMAEELARVKGTMAEEEIKALWGEGRAMSLDQACELAG
jgi:predicted ATPase/class 3 adenylate cyclase